MPKLVRLYIRHVIIGYGLSAVFVALLLWLNVANLGHLILGSDMGAVALAMMVVFNGIVFSGVQFGIAVMRMSEESAPPAGGRPVRLAPRPVAVAAAGAQTGGRGPAGRGQAGDFPG